MDARLAIGVLGTALTILAIWVGVRKLELSRAWQFLTGFLEFAVLVASLVFLGPILGTLLALLAVSGWFLISSARLTFQYDKVATDAAIHWRISRKEAKEFIRRLTRSEERPFLLLGLLGTARLAAALAKCARSPQETALIAKPIALLGVVFHADPAVLAPRVDGLMRQFGEPPERAMHVADVLTRASQLTPGSFERVMEGLEMFAEELGSLAVSDEELSPSGPRDSRPYVSSK